MLIWFVLQAFNRTQSFLLTFTISPKLTTGNGNTDLRLRESQRDPFYNTPNRWLRFPPMQADTTTFSFTTRNGCGTVLNAPIELMVSSVTDMPHESSTFYPAISCRKLKFHNKNVSHHMLEPAPMPVCCSERETHAIHTSVKCSMKSVSAFWAFE